METLELQQQFFNHLKNSLPSHISLAEDLAQLLDLGYDSVYRRIRGEKHLTLSELKTICHHYKISLDHVLQLQNDTILFRDHTTEHKDFGKYLAGMMQLIEYFNRFKKRDLLYLCKDAPFFHFFHTKELASFKVFFWLKSIWNLPEYADKYYSYADYPYDEYFKTGSRIIEEYNKIPSIELWNFESISSTISQIKYYTDAGVFKTGEDLALVVDSMVKMLRHLQSQAELGIKYEIGNGEAGYRAPIKFYVNEIILGHNNILFENETSRLAFINYSGIDYISSVDKIFVDRVFTNFHNLTSRSALISQSGEKERQKFFKNCIERVQACKKSF